jgi:Ser/Thr protein kinase RdoA (MazF antagonist)
MEWLESVNESAGSWGLIHGDFERTNFTIDGGVIRPYDFDDACYHWYVADIAHALWAFRGAPRSDRGQFLDWFLDGYRERSPIGTDVREQLSWFVRLRSLSLFVARVGSTADGEWDHRMRAWFDEAFSW